jgi:tetratricopeptide (TPR) repeat protein
MLAGLAAAQLGLLPALTRSRTELAEELAKKELRRLARFVHTPGNEAEKQAIWHVAACATIQRGLTLKELDATVEEELAALKTVWRDGPGDLASVFRRVLPDVTLVVAPIEPDFVGEALVLMVLARPLNQGPERWSDWSRVVERCCRRKPQATATFLLHALQNFGGDAKYSESLLTGMDVLISAGIAEAEPRLLTAIEAAMIPMREDASLSEFERTEVESRAVNVTAHLYARLKAAWRHGREELRPEVARIASNLSVRLSDLDRDVEALDPASEAVELYRPLAKEDWRFRVNLADALSNLAITLGHLGRKEEGVRLAEEAVESYRMLLSQKSLFPVGLLTPPPPFVVAGLSRTLNNLANSLCGLEKWAEALALAQESVALCRILVRLNENYESELANRLGTVTRVMAGMGRQADVAEAAAEAIRLLHPRFKRRPEAWDPVLRVLIRIYVEATTATHIQSDEAMSLVISEISEMLNGLDVEEHKPRYK